MVKFTKEDINIGGSIFWILLILISLSGLLYLFLWSFHANSIKGTIISTLFFAMIVSGIILSRNKIFDMNSWGDNSLSMMIGLFSWGILGSIFGKQSTLDVTVPQNYLFATISSELPIFAETILNNFIVPIAEEIFWMVGIPFTLISIMNQIGKKYPIFKNDVLQIIVIILIGSLSFAFFHVGKLFIGFIISAIIFRTIMIVMVMGDYKFDLLKGINLVAGFSVGSHIANNIIDTGIRNTWTIMSTNMFVSGIIILIFGAMFISAINRILLFVVGKNKNLMDEGSI